MAWNDRENLDKIAEAGRLPVECVQPSYRRFIRIITLPGYEKDTPLLSADDLRRMAAEMERLQEADKRQAKAEKVKAAPNAEAIAALERALALLRRG